MSPRSADNDAAEARKALVKSNGEMCGGAILAELLASSPARRVTGAHIWPQGWVGTDGSEPAFGEFHSGSDYDSDSDSESIGALPDFWLQRPWGLSAFDVIPHPTWSGWSDLDLEWLASLYPEYEGMPARASGPDSDSIGPLPGFLWQNLWGLSAVDVMAHPTMSNMEWLASQFPEYEGMLARAFDSATESIVALSRRRSLSAFDVIRIPAPPTRISLEWLVPQFPEREGMPAILFIVDVVQSNAKAAVDLWSFADKFVFFDGGAYESLDSLFGVDAAQSNAKAAAGLWSFDND